jgi:hypothetical protein
MRPLPSIAATALLALSTVAATGAARAAELQTDTQSFAVSRQHRVRLEFPIGELRVLPSDDSRVRFDLRVRCKSRSDERCMELANELRLESDDDGGTLSLKLEGYPKWQRKGFTAMGELRVPRALAVKIEMGVGQLEIEGLLGDLDVDLGVGQADVRIPRANVREVSVDTGIGDASIRGAGSSSASSRFLGTRVEWSEGRGRADVRIHVGVGEGTVRLE